MENLEQVMDENELCIKALKREIDRLNSKILLLDKAVYEGYYDEIGDYIVNFQREDLETALEKLFGAKDVNILH